MNHLQRLRSISVALSAFPCARFSAQAVRAGLLAALLVTPALAAEAGPAPDAPAPSSLRDPEDGQFDVSGFLDKAYGFIPLVIPITEPAVGYGAAGGLVFIDRPKNPEPGSFARPNLTLVGGLATENGTWGALALDSRYWREDRLQTLVGGIYASVNLDYYGIGDDSLLRDHPLRYNLTPRGGLVRGKLRLGQSRFWGGLGYSLASTGVSFSAPPGTPGLPSFQRDTRTANLGPSLSYDTRDNIFTPTRGLYAEANAALYSEALGGDQDFQKAGLIVIGYLPLADKWTLGVRADANFSFGDVPFYLRPYVALRGVAVMSYQGENVAQAEAEVRWQFWRRYSLVVFSGVGTAWNDSGPYSRQETATTVGTGLRYEIARKYGLHMGIDLAFGPADPAIYIQFGSAWMRP